MPELRTAFSSNSETLMQKIARDYGARYVSGNDRYADFFFDHPTENKAFNLQEITHGVEGPAACYRYKINQSTPEGQALLAKLEDIPGTSGELKEKSLGNQTKPLHVEKKMDTLIRKSAPNPVSPRP